MWIGAGLLKRAGTLFKQAGLKGEAAVITAGKAGRLYLPMLGRSLKTAGFPVTVVPIPDGEKGKSLGVAAQVWSTLLKKGLDRSATLVALGGGAVGDLAGFVASTYMRGIRLVHCPTTLLACVDSAIGGKTGVNLPEGKNLVGTFYQPALVIEDVSTLKSLSPRQVSAGLAEVIKYGVIRDAALFAYLERRVADLRGMKEDAMTHAIAQCVRIKADVVSRDERESNLRAILNYGHTIGHALEASGQYRTLTHGEAVSLGMMCAARLALWKGAIKPFFVARQEALLRKAGLPTRMRRVPVARVLEHLVYDKKRSGGRQRFVIPTRLGKVVVADGYTTPLIRRALAELKWP